MEEITNLFRVNRRQLLKASLGVAAGLGLGRAAWGRGCEAKKGTVRDRLWLFAGPANADYPYHQQRSLMTPAEGAFYLDVPNIIMIQNHTKWGEFVPPLSQYAIALRPLKRVVWSLVGSSGYTTPEYRTEVIEMAKHTPNFTGFYLDDFFFTGKKQEREGRQAALTLDQLRAIRRQARGPGRKLDIWVTYYTGLLNLPLDPYLKLLDVITLWTWRSEDLKHLESNFKKTDQLPGNLRRTLGCYFFDFTKREPLTVAQMKLQCEAGLEWLRQGKIEGIVFLSNSEEDLGFESVEWTRRWIRKVGNLKV